MPLHSAERRLLTTLNNGWRELVDSQPQLPPAWAAQWPCFADVADLPTCLVRPFGRSDSCLFALLSLTRDGDAYAARTVFQSLLPTMVRMAGRDESAELSDYTAHLWCRIRTYPLERRPSHVANNLELDTLKAVRRERRRDPLVPVIADELERLCERRHRPDEPAGPGAGDVIGAARALGLVDEYTSRVLHTVYADGMSGREAAALLDTTVDLVRWRCSKAVRSLARHAQLLADAA